MIVTCEEREFLKIIFKKPRWCASLLSSQIEFYRPSAWFFEGKVSLHYYKHHIGDYKRDTSHLTLLEHGVYRQLIDLYYLLESPIPDFEFAIKKIGARKNYEKTAVKNILDEFFDHEESGYSHKKCDHLILKYKVTSNVRSEAANAKWLKNKEVNDANALQTECKQDASASLTINHKPLTNKPLNISCPIEEKLSDITTVANAPIDSVDGHRESEVSNLEQTIEYDDDLYAKKKGMKKSPQVAAAPLLRDAREVLDYLNEKAGRNYRHVGENLKMIAGRLKSSTVEECKAIIEKKCRDWLGDEKMSQYLRPATIFNATKFAQYQGELQTKSSTISDDRIRLQRQADQIKKQMGLA